MLMELGAERGSGCTSKDGYRTHRGDKSSLWLSHITVAPDALREGTKTCNLTAQMGSKDFINFGAGAGAGNRSIATQV